MEIIFNKTKKLILLGIVFLMIISFKMPTLAAKTTITLDRKEVTLFYGETTKIDATVKNIKEKRVHWTTSNKNVATVSSSGVVRPGKKTGTATITATTADGTSAKCKVNFLQGPAQPAAMKISLNKEKVNLKKGGSIKLKATVKPSNARKDLVWKSSNEKIATVTSDGTVKGLKTGKAMITVKAFSGIIATCEINVYTPVKDIKLNKSKADLQMGKSIKLKATVTPSDADNKEITWKSSNTKVATVDSTGKVTAKKAGNVTITAISKSDNSKKTTCAIKVYGMNLSDKGMKILASVINAEQGDQSKKGQIAVAYVIKNRLGSNLTDENLLAKLTAKNQFESVQTYKKYDTYKYTFNYNGVKYYTKKYTEQSLQVAKDVINGKVKNPIGTRKYFNTAGTYKGKDENAITIGGNTFFAHW